MLASTIAGYVGEFGGPLLAGSLKDHLAPHYAVIDAGGGERIVDPRCATSAADQHGLFLVIYAVQAMIAIAALFWLLAAIACRSASSQQLSRHIEGPNSKSGATSGGVKSAAKSEVATRAELL